MAQKNTPEGLEGLDKLIAETRGRLEANPDFVLLNALNKARAEVAGVNKGAIPTPARTMSLVDYSQMRHPDEDEPTPKKISQLEGAARALELVGHPLPADQLMEKAVEQGAVIGASKPVISFGSSLSKSEKFKSVRWNGEYAWWFADRPLPETGLTRRMSRLAAE